MPALRRLNDLPIMSDAALKSIEDLLKAVNDASGSARALFVTLMVLALYFLIVVSGTDDMALLRNATVAVPTLSNATLPARAFYICAPLVFVFLHLDLLIHLKLLSDKLFRFNQLLETSVLDEQAVRDYRLRLAGFPFSNWLGSDPRTGRMAHALQGAMVWLTLVLLPLTVLMAMQLGFLAYQSEAVTWLHRVALIIDAGLLLYFWVAFRYGRYRPADAASSPLRDGVGECLSGKIHEFYKKYLEADRARQYKWRFSIIGRLMRGLKRVWAVMVQSVFALAMLFALALLVVQLFAFVVDQRIFAFAALASGSVLFFAWLMPLFPALFGALRQSAGDIALGAWTFASRRWPVLMPAAPLLLLSLTVATIPDEAADRASRWLYGWMEGRTQDDPSPDGGLTSLEFAAQIHVVRASLSGGGESKDAKSLEMFEGARCARWLAAAMPGMPDAKDRLPGTARQASAPEGSALAFYLENANRMPQNMRASCPTIALFHLKGGWFHRTLAVTGKVVARSDIRPELAKDLRASLREYSARARTGEGPDADLANKYDDMVAQTEGLDMSERSLRWADFTGAALPKAILDRAQLQHAILTSSDLRKVNLGQAWLAGADMRGATLTGADMRRATLTGADMFGAWLTGADMWRASAKGAVFPDETMQRSGILTGGLETGRYSERDIESTLAELTRASTFVGEVSREVLSAALARLKARINEATAPDRFTDCIGGAPCGDDDARQRQSALHRAALFETLICPPDTRGKTAGTEYSVSRAKALVQRLSHDRRLGQSMSDNPDYRTLEYVRFAAEDTLRRLATRRCAPPEAQALIDDWAREHPPSAKEHQP